MGKHANSRLEKIFLVAIGVFVSALNLALLVHFA